MRYELDANGYVLNVFWGCHFGECQEYTGTIPSGYESLIEWSEKANINAYYIEDGNLVYDADKDIELQLRYEQETIDNTPILYKDLYGSIQILNSQYQTKTAVGKVIAINDVKRINPKVKFTNINCYDFNKIDIVTQKRNMLKNDAKTETIGGIKFTKLIDGGINIKGTSTEDIEYNLSGSGENTTSIFVLKKGMNYYLNIGGLNCEMKYYDGTTSQVYVGASGLINLTEDKEVTQVLINIPSGTTIDKTIYPMLEYGASASPYEEYETRRLTIDFSDFLEEVIFPSDDLFPSDSLYPRGSIVDCIQIEEGKIYISINGTVKFLGKGNVNLFDGYDTLYTLQDTNIEMTYCINVLDVESLEFLQGKSTTTNKFRILEDGSIEAHNGYFSGNVEADGGEIGGFTLTPEKFTSTSSITRNYTEADLTRITKLSGNEIEPTSEDYEKYDLNGDKCFTALDILRVRKMQLGDLSSTQNGYFTINSNDPVHCLVIKNSETDIDGVSLGLYGGYISELGVKQLTSVMKTSDENTKLNLSSRSINLNNYNNNNFTSVSADGITTPVVTQTSLEEYKKNFEKFDNALPILNEIDIYKYNLKHEEDGHKKHLGFVIGENYNYSSEITTVDENGKEIGVDNYSMTSLCLQAIKELNAKVETLENKIKEMESEK